MTNCSQTPTRITSSSTLTVCLFSFGSTRDLSHSWVRPCASAARTAYWLKLRTMIGAGVRSSIVTVRCLAVVVIHRMDAGSDSNHRVTGTPHANHGTVVGTKPRTQRKGAQARCARGMCDRRARRCTMNVRGRVSWKKRAVYVFVFSISRLKSTIASAAVSRNGRTEGAGTRCGPELEPVGFGAAAETDD